MIFPLRVSNCVVRKRVITQLCQAFALKHFLCSFFRPQNLRVEKKSEICLRGVSIETQSMRWVWRLGCVPCNLAPAQNTTVRSAQENWSRTIVSVRRVEWRHKSLSEGLTFPAPLLSTIVRNISTLFPFLCGRLHEGEPGCERCTAFSQCRSARN